MTNGKTATLMVWLSLSVAVLVCGCSGPQSTLDPAGESAEKISRLFWWMTSGAAVIWTVVMGLAVYAIKFNRGTHDVRQSRFWIIGGGVVAPTIVLTGLLAYGLAMIPELVAPAPADSLKIRVRGAQWWWRVQYQDPSSDGNVFDLRIGDMNRSSRRDDMSNQIPLNSDDRDFNREKPNDQPEIIELANEIRLPVNRPVQFYLESEDVIHSFWIPSLGGKVDMIPGRQTRLSLLPTRTGIFRGACAEYCGASHSWMNFYVIVMEQDDFERWYQAQSQSALEPDTPERIRGKRLFISNGCSACHTIRGTAADGTIGPDLTHVGSRVSLAAGVFTGGNAKQPSINSDDFFKWLNDPDHYKPSAHMPDFGMLSKEDVRAIAEYLYRLK